MGSDQTDINEIILEEIRSLKTNSQEDRETLIRIETTLKLTSRQNENAMRKLERRATHLEDLTASQKSQIRSNNNDIKILYEKNSELRAELSEEKGRRETLQTVVDGYGKFTWVDIFKFSGGIASALFLLYLITPALNSLNW